MLANAVENAPIVLESMNRKFGRRLGGVTEENHPTLYRCQGNQKRQGSRNEMRLVDARTLAIGSEHDKMTLKFWRNHHLRNSASR